MPDEDAPRLGCWTQGFTKTLEYSGTYQEFYHSLTFEEAKQILPKLVKPFDKDVCPATLGVDPRGNVCMNEAGKYVLWGTTVEDSSVETDWTGALQWLERAFGLRE